MKFFVLGSVALDTIFSVDKVPSIGERIPGVIRGRFAGGMAANQAVVLGSLVEEVYLLGQVGPDSEGAIIADELQKRRVKTPYLRKHAERATGQTYMYVVAQNDYFSVVVRGANDELQPDDFRQCFSTATQDDWLVAQMEIDADVVEATFRSARAARMHTVLCASPYDARIPRILPYCDFVICNQREGLALFNLDLSTLREPPNELRHALRGKTLVVTLSDRGALAISDESLFRVSGLPVRALDSIGAGDAFTGAFVAAVALGRDLRSALVAGNVAGAMTTTVYGAQGWPCSWDEIAKCSAQFDLIQSKS